MTYQLNAGSTPYHYLSAGSANQDSQNVKTAPGWLNSIALFNTNSAIRYVKLYDLATAPTSSNTPVQTYLLPGGSAGAGMTLSIPGGMVFQNGIAFRMTTGQADNDANAVSAGDVVLAVTYS